MEKVIEYLKNNGINYILKGVGKYNECDNYKVYRGKVRHINYSYVCYDDEFENEKIYITGKNHENYIPELRIMKYNNTELYYIRNNGYIIDYCSYEKLIKEINNFVKSN